MADQIINIGGNLILENTLTYTARSLDDPEKSATFTLHNGTVSLQLDNTVMEQLEQPSPPPEAGVNAADWTRRIATGTVQKMLRPLPINDFEARLDGDTLQTTAWMRANGLRVAPVTMTWDKVDNPQAAQAFVEEVHERQKSATEVRKLPAIWDYWASWIVVGLSGLVVIVGMIRLLKRFLAEDTTLEAT